MDFTSFTFLIVGLDEAKLAAHTKHKMMAVILFILPPLNGPINQSLSVLDNKNILMRRPQGNNCSNSAVRNVGAAYFCRWTKPH